jgi:adenine-specific DNA-methyltransferase
MESVFDQSITRESIAIRIDELGRKYHALPEAYRANMSEQDVRDYFITPLLEALGWGIVDPRERSAERYLPRQGFSDYELCLPIGPDDRDPYAPVIYVEAKKFDSLAPLEPDLFGYAKRSEADKQVIEYADQFNFKRGEKIGWAILTNFQHLRVWDTRRNILVESVDWFSDLKRDRTLEILYLLSRDQVAQDPTLRSLGGFRKLPDIDEQFLLKLNEWRSALAYTIWAHETNRPKLGDKRTEQQSHLRSAVQRTLDRLIVIRTAEDRGLLPLQYRLQEMVRNFGGQEAVPLNLLENIQRNTFAYFDHRYNSKLFGPHLADQMEVHNAPLSRIIDEMCKVSFAAMNADILGATYEQYLGQTIEIDPQTNKPKLAVNLETRHEQGSYYTPRRIVHAILDRTLGKYLFGTPDGLPGLISNATGRKRVAEIQDLCILDPACGSGSFLIYAFDILLDFYSTERARVLREVEARLQQIISTGIPRLAAESQHDPELLRLRSELELTRLSRARIIERHLYGVDLDAQAAEVASMNLLLKALTRDERLPRILGDNIKVGNSLISGVDPSEEMSAFAPALSELSKIRVGVHQATLLASENDQDRPTHEATIDRLEQESRDLANRVNSSVNEALRLKDEEGWFDDPRRVVPFNWQVEFPERFGAVENPGFTFVVGNPPYVGFHGFGDQKPFFKHTYASASGKFDLYVPFVERGIRLAQHGGELGFICPSTFMKRGFGRNLRQFILDNTAIRSIHDFLHTQVFRGVLNYTCILLLRRELASPVHALDFSEGDLGTSERPYAQDKLSDNVWIFRFGIDEALVSRLQADSRLIELGDPRLSSGVAEGIVTGNNSVLLFHEDAIRKSEFEMDFLRPCVRGEDVKRYQVTWGGFYVFYPYQQVDGKMRVIEEPVVSKKCPKLHAYLVQCKKSLESRTYLTNSSKRWFEIWCPRDMRDQAAEKIVVPELADRSQFARVGRDFFYVDTTCGFTTHRGVDPWYLLAILNSQAGEFLYRKTTVPKANNFLIYKTMFLNPFIVPDPDKISIEQRTRLCELAESIQTTNTLGSAIESAFAELLAASLPVTDAPGQNFQHNYYGVSTYWRQRRILAPSALEMKDQVVSIRVLNPLELRDNRQLPTSTLILSYRSEQRGPWKALVELEPIDDDVKLFLFFSIRRFLSENTKRKTWKLIGRGASKRTVDVVLQNLVLPVWSLPFAGGATAEQAIREKASEIIQALRSRFPGDDLNPSMLEARVELAEKEIDEIVFDIYGFRSEERELASRVAGSRV